MKWVYIGIFLLPVLGLAQSNFSFSGYTANRTYTNNAYTFTNTQNGYTMSARVTHNANPGWMNLTGQTSPNYATYIPTGCSNSVTGLYLASNRSNVSTTITLELSFSPAVCGPVTFRIYDINGEDVDVSLGYGFRDDITISAYDQSNTQIALSTAMVTNNGSGNCGGGNYGASYVHMVGNALKVVGCTYDNCEWDYFTISSSTRMIGRIVIDYASGNRDWYGTTITNPARQWIIVTDVRAWTPAMNITPNCGSNPVQLTGSLTSAFPPSTSSWGIPNASYPAVPSGNRPGAPTYSWSGTGVTFNPATGLTTLASGLSDGSNVLLTGQNNRGCVATRTLGLTTANCSVLPVELISFDGRCENGQRIFTWATASEYKNDHFVLEQSEDAINFVPFATFEGAGYSQQVKNYEYVSAGGGGQYFRLKQVDDDGTFRYYDIISVPCSAPGELQIYPNPVSQFLNLDWSFEPAHIRLVDVLGRELNCGIFHLNSNQGAYSLDISTLSGGVYLCQVLDPGTGGVVAQQKFVKQ